MNVLDDLLRNLGGDDAPVRQVLVGIHWVVVCSRYCGMASALVGEHTHGQGGVRDVGYLQEKSARELAEFVHSDNLLEASLGMAAINSLLPVDKEKSVEINAADVLTQQGKDSNVVVVGSFPFVSKLRKQVRNLWVLELHPTEGEFSAEAAHDLIPQADVIAITGCARINHTMDNLLSLCSPAATVMVLGPSTPFSPVMFRHGINILSGVLVVNEIDVLRTVSQGANFRQVKGVRLLSQIKGREKT
jgi:uncharacterized protein